MQKKNKYDYLKKFEQTPEYIGSKEYSMCSRKIKYESERIARREADRIELERGTKLRVYKCSICKKFHHTSKGILN